MEAKEWLDKVADNAIERKKIEHFGEETRIIGDFGCILVGYGIIELAEKAGIKLVEKHRDCEDYPFSLSFVYRGIEFSELFTKEGWEHVRAAGK